MSVQTEFYADGHDVTNEIVTCSVAVTINAVTYYAGWLQEATNDQVIGNTDATYGAATAQDLGGTRYDVLKMGVPSTNECVLDKTTGRVLTSSQVTLYFTYVGYGRLFKWWDRPVTIYKHGVMDSSGGNLDLHDTIEFEYGAGFAAGQVIMDEGPTGADLVFRIQKASGDADVGSKSADITVSDGTHGSGWTAFPNRLKFQPGEHLRITAQQESPIPGLPTNPTIFLLPG